MVVGGNIFSVRFKVYGAELGELLTHAHQQLLAFAPQVALDAWQIDMDTFPSAESYQGNIAKWTGEVHAVAVS